jgi:ADP-L-glycero-D-manno-heptose 6-epimerase
MIIVTGGAGFIGSNLVAALQDRGLEDIVVCDVKNEEDKLLNLSKRDIKDHIAPEEIFDYLNSHADEIEVIFHMGAISSTTEMNVDLIMENNFHLSRRLADWCAANNIRLIYASSAATYGDGSFGFVDDESANKLEKLEPLNPYGLSKHLFDRHMIAANDSGEALPPQWAGLKFFNVYGPNEYHKGGQKSVICHLYPQIETTGKAKLFKSYNPDYDDGGQTRDFIYVDDCVSVMLWLYDNPDVSGIYNVGTGKTRSFRDLALAVFKALGKEPSIEYIDMPEIIRDKYQYFTEANMDKLREAGYSKDFTDLEEGTRRYVQDFLANDDQYR